MDYLNKISFPICHKCQSSLHCSNINNSINFSCKCNTSTIPISVYYSLINNNSGQCNQHNNKHYNHFCLFCSSYICDDCLQSHQSHYIITLSNESSSFFSKFKFIHLIKDLDKVGYLLLLNDGRLIIADYCYFLIMNLDTYNIELKVEDESFNSDLVCFLQLKNSIVVASYTCDGLLFFRINKNNYSVVHRIKSSNNQSRNDCANTMLCHIDENSFAACLQGKISIINANEPYDIIFSLEGHVTTIGGMLKIKNENLLITGSNYQSKIDYCGDPEYDEKEEETIRIWDLNQKKMFKNILWYRLFFYSNASI